MDGARCDSLRKSPLDAGWFAGVAGVLPIDVPAGFELEVEAGVVRAGMKLRFRRDELDVNVREIGGAGSGVDRESRAERDGKGEDRS